MNLRLENKYKNGFGQLSLGINYELTNADCSIKEFVFRCLFGALYNNPEQDIRAAALKILKNVLDQYNANLIYEFNKKNIQCMGIMNF